MKVEGTALKKKWPLSARAQFVQMTFPVVVYWPHCGAFRSALTVALCLFKILTCP